MFKDAFIIFKKEMKNVIKDKASIFSLFILPLILIPAIFVTLGMFTEKQETETRETVYSIQLENHDERFEELLANFISYEKSDNENSLRVVFPEGNEGTVEIYYDSTSQKLSYAANQIESAINQYEMILGESFLNKQGLSYNDLNFYDTSRVDLAPEEAQDSQFLAMMIPYMLVIYIFAGSLNIGLDTTAGEKERGSLASILVNQVSRTSIAFGKVMYVITIGLINSLVTFLALVIAFSFNANVLGADIMGGSASFFDPSSVLGLLFTLLLMAGLASSIIVMLGSLAKNLKQGSGYVMPIYILALVIGIATMNMDASAEFYYYLIPIVNNVLVLKEIIMSQFSMMNFSLMVVSDLILISIFVFITSKIFNTEKILNTI
ncbi:MAG: ABC transporter permease [Thermotogota bacterium]